MSDWCDYRDMQDRDRGYIQALDDDLYGNSDNWEGPNDNWEDEYDDA